MISAATGGTLVFRAGRFDPDDVLRIIEAERITAWSAIGSMGPRVLESPELATRDLSSLTRLGSGGAPMSPDLQARLRAAFPTAAHAFGMGYGSSESVAVVCTIGGQDLIDRPTAAGTINHTMEVEIRDDAGNPVPDGTEGRGPRALGVHDAALLGEP